MSKVRRIYLWRGILNEAGAPRARELVSLSVVLSIDIKNPAEAGLSKQDLVLVDLFRANQGRDPYGYRNFVSCDPFVRFVLSIERTNDCVIFDLFVVEHNNVFVVHRLILSKWHVHVP